jgi:hypothetical protein
LYIFSKQDFVLLRQNISLKDVFDLAILDLIISIFIGRIFFVLNDFRFDLLNVIKFLYLPKFPGMLLLGFLIGAILGIYILFKKKKGLYRIYDIFSLAFFPLFLFFVIFDYITKPLIFIPILILGVILFGFFISSHKKYKLKDGTISLILLLLVSAESLISQKFDPNRHILFVVISFSQIIAIILISTSIVGIFVNQKTKRS